MGGGPIQVASSAGLYADIVGRGRPVLFLHGLGGSGRYWGQGFNDLAGAHRLVFVDLAGFGRSRQVPGPYDIDGHLERLAELRREHLPGGGLVVVGHSFGAALAFAAAACWPSVAAVLGLGLPTFASPDQARRHLAGLGTMERWMATDSHWAAAACWTICRFRPVARVLAPRLAPDVPPQVARDGIEHTWRSYDQSFRSLVEDTDLRAWAVAGPAASVVLQGDADRIAPPAFVDSLLGDTGVDLRVVRGDHHLLLSQPAACHGALVAMLADLDSQTKEPPPPDHRSRSDR